MKQTVLFLCLVRYVAPWNALKPFLGPRQRMLVKLYCFRLVRLSVRPSVRLSVVTLTQSFLIGFLPNFIYGLLPSTSRSSSNTGFVRHPIRKIHLSISAVVVTLTQPFLIGFLPNFIYELLLSIFHSSSKLGFIRHQITKMADKMATAYQCLLSWSLLLSHFLSDLFQISYIDSFHQTLIQVRICVLSGE